MASPNTTKKKPAASRSGSGKASGRSTSKAPRKNSAQAKAEAAAREHASRQLWAIIVFALGVLFASVTLIKGQNIWSLLHNFILGLFGWSAFLIAPIFFYIAIMATMDKPLGSVKHKIWQTFLLAGFFSGAVQIFGMGIPDTEGFLNTARELYEAGIDLQGGGLISGIFGLPLLHWFGGAGAKITICLLLFVALMILTGATLIGLYTTAQKPVKKIEQAYTERVIQHREEKEEAVRNRFNIDIPLDDAPHAQRETENLEPFPVSKEHPAKESSMRTQKAKDKLLGKQSSAIDMPMPQAPSAAAVPPIPTTPSEPPAAPEPTESIPLPEEPPEAPMLDEIIGKLVDAVPLSPQPDDFAKQVAVENALRPEDSMDTSDEFLDDEDIEISQEPFQRLEKALAPEEPPAPPEYQFPPMDLLDEPVIQNNENLSEELKTNAAKLVDTLQSFGVQTKIIDIARGPAVTRYELQPSAGVKISKITNLADDIALNLAASGVRIEAPIPNKPAVGIEVPNKSVTPVKIREILESDAFAEHPSKLAVALGKDIAGVPAIADLAKMPHTLIAGSTGSGKSVCINSIIVSLLYKANPEQVKLLMVDPKMVELGIYNGIPHLLVPVVTDPKKAAGALNWAVTEMLNRYQLFKENSVRDLAGYNRMAAASDTMKEMPQIVIIIDELADLMIAAPAEVEDAVCRLAQMARAAGMHLVIATQRPSVDVITGVIKANIPSRIAFAVSSQVDSRTILDSAGAEKLLGKGDMLFYPMGASKPTRVQGCFVTDMEVERIVEFVKGDGGVNEYDQQVIEEIERHAVTEKKKSSGNDGGGFDDEDEMLPSAIECVIDAGQASTSLLQRKLKLGYARAARIIDAMEEKGIVGPYEGSKPRAVLISRERWIEMKLGATQRAREEWGD